MRSFTRLSLVSFGLGLIASINAQAQTPDVMPVASGGYQPYTPPAQAPMTAPVAADPAMGLDGKPVAAAPMMEAPHKHKGKTLCAKCAAKLGATMPPGKITGCAHSKNGACSACMAALNMPGQFVMSAPPAASAPSAEAPGRAVASNMPAAAGRSMMRGMANAPEDMGPEPVPVGVVQANFSQGNPMGSPSATFAPQAQQPGRAMAESNTGRDPYSPRVSRSRPHILGHLFGWSGIGADRAEERARRKSETHAMISYDTNGSTPVDEVPASMVYGKK